TCGYPRRVPLLATGLPRTDTGSTSRPRSLTSQFGPTCRACIRLPSRSALHVSRNRSLESARMGIPLRWFRWAMVLLVFGGASVTRADPDLWGHVRFGLDTMHARRLTSVDPYSFTQDVPWVNHEWLSEVQMGAAYATGGDTGLALLKAALTGG